MTRVPSPRKIPKAVSMASVLTALFIGSMSIFLGVVSLTPMVSSEYHRDMRTSYNAYAKSLTYVTKYVDRVQLSFYLRNVMGGCQILFGFCLAFLSAYLRYIGNCGLLLTTGTLLALQFISGVTMERKALSIVLTLLLSVRLIMGYQRNKLIDKASRIKTPVPSKASKTRSKNKSQ